MSAELLSLLALLIALTSTVINYLLLKNQNEPEVIVYASADYERHTIINLLIENSGNGIARDVSFSSNVGIPDSAFGIQNAKKPETMKEGPFINGIAFLASGEKRIITWGQYGGLKAGQDDQVLEITATYFSSPSLGLRRRKHTLVSAIDLKSFEKTDASNRNWGKQAVDELKKAVKSLEKISKG